MEPRDKFLYEMIADWYWHKTTGNDDDFLHTSEEAEEFAKKIMDIIQQAVTD